MQDTNNTGPTQENARPASEGASNRGELRWIKSFDMRMVPRHMLENSRNEEMIPEQFMAFADFMMAVNNPRFFIFYGVGESGIESALLATHDPVDNCLHLINAWAVPLREHPQLVEEIKRARDEMKVTAVKMVRSKIINLEA